MHTVCRNPKNKLLRLREAAVYCHLSVGLKGFVCIMICLQYSKQKNMSGYSRENNRHISLSFKQTGICYCTVWL